MQYDGFLNGPGPGWVTAWHSSRKPGTSDPCLRAHCTPWDRRRHADAAHGVTASKAAL